MNVHTSVGIHGLDADSIRYGVYVQERSASIVLDDGTQLHWDSLDALDGFVARLGELAAEARSKVETVVFCGASHCDGDYEVGGDVVYCDRERGHDGNHRAELGEDQFAAWSDSTPGAVADQAVAS